MKVRTLKRRLFDAAGTLPNKWCAPYYLWNTLGYPKPRGLPVK